MKHRLLPLAITVQHSMLNCRNAALSVISVCQMSATEQDTTQHFVHGPVTVKHSWDWALQFKLAHKSTVTTDYTLRCTVFNRNCIAIQMRNTCNGDSVYPSRRGCASGITAACVVTTMHVGPYRCGRWSSSKRSSCFVEVSARTAGN